MPDRLSNTDIMGLVGPGQDGEDLRVPPDIRFRQPGHDPILDYSSGSKPSKMALQLAKYSTGPYPYMTNQNLSETQTRLLKQYDFDRAGFTDENGQPLYDASGKLVKAPHE